MTRPQRIVGQKRGGHTCVGGSSRSESGSVWYRAWFRCIVELSIEMGLRPYPLVPFCTGSRREGSHLALAAGSTGSRLS